jgi:hypothetical protein
LHVDEQDSCGCTLYKHGDCKDGEYAGRTDVYKASDCMIIKQNSSGCTRVVTVQKAGMHVDQRSTLKRLWLHVHKGNSYGCTRAVTVQKVSMHGDQRCAGALNACS